MDENACPRVIFVVDDDAGIRESLEDVLAGEGYCVVSATDGSDALGKLRASPHRLPCVILLDLMMPVMTGSQFYAEKQRDPRLASIPVVLLSADALVREKARAFGAEYLAKPVKLELILEAIARHC